MCIGKEKAVHHYADLIVKVVEENSQITQEGGRGVWVECQLRISKSEVCLDQNWMFVNRGKEGAGGLKFILFCRCQK